MMWSPSIPYSKLSFLPPTSIEDLETKDVLKLCTKARVALEHLKMTVECAPHRQAILSTLPLLETRYSCEIEDLKATPYDLFLYRDKYRYAPPNVMRVLRCERALSSAPDLLTTVPFGQGFAKEICARVNGFRFYLRTATESYSDDEPIPILYAPPTDWQDIVNRLVNWEIYVNSETEIDPLIVMALAYYQFEAIRPFSRGSSKTNRILNQLFLMNQNIIGGPYLGLSRHFARNKEDYFRTLFAVGQSEEWLNWIKFVLAGVYESAVWSTKKAEEINAMQVSLREKINEEPELKKINSPLLEGLLATNPFVRIKHLVDAELVRRKTGSKYLNLLAEKGILEKIHSKRGDVFVNHSYLDLLSQD